MSEVNQAHKVIGICAFLTVIIGSANAILKHKRPPTTRFLIGSGMAYFLLSAFAEVEPDIAKGLASGVLSTVLLSGDAGGLLSYIDRGEFDTKKPKQETPTQNPRQRNRDTVLNWNDPRAKAYTVDAVPPIPGLPSVHPVRRG